MTIIGLGNPGSEYRNTRHNAGMMFLAQWAQQHRKRFRRTADHRVCRIPFDGQELLLVKPIAWMNQSGVVVARLVKKYGEPFIIVSDDTALPLGKLRLRSRGSDGGHKGLRSIIEDLRTEDFMRLRIGIGPPHGDPVQYVLSRFSGQESDLLKTIFTAGIRGVEITIREGFPAGQNFLNGINLTEKKNDIS